MAKVKEQKFFPYVKQSINDGDIEAVCEVLRSDFITRGPKTKDFEEAICEYCGCDYAVAVTNGTAALQGACFAAKVSSHDRLVTTPNTFVATVGCGIQFGAEPVFVDIDRKTGNIDLDKLKFNMQYPSTRGRSIYIPVHFAGIPVDMQALESMIKEPESVVIEDAAHAIGSVYQDGSRVGSCTKSDMTIFSFHPAKNITTGEGGIVTTNNENLYRRLLLFRNIGIEKDQNNFINSSPGPWYYEVQKISGNYYMTDMQAALGLSQLKRLDSFIKKKRKLVKAYRKNLAAETAISFFEPEDEDKVAYHLMVLQIDFSQYGKDKATVMRQLQEAGIGTQVHYIPIYRHPFFTEKKQDISTYFPETETYYQRALSVPLYPDLKEREVANITSKLLEILKN